MFCYRAQTDWDNIPYCVARPHFVYPFIGWWAFGLFSTSWLLWIMLLWTLMCKFLCGHVFSVLGMWLECSCWVLTNLCSTFWGMGRTVFQSAFTLDFHNHSRNIFLIRYVSHNCFKNFLMTVLSCWFFSYPRDKLAFHPTNSFLPHSPLSFLPRILDFELKGTWKVLSSALPMKQAFPYTSLTIDHSAGHLLAHKKQNVSSKTLFSSKHCLGFQSAFLRT